MSDLLERVPAEVRPDVEALLTENRLLRQELRLLRIEKFGKKSERLSDGQLDLLEEEISVGALEVEMEAALDEEQKQAIDAQCEGRAHTPRRHPGREELPAHLERREVIVSLEGEDCRCAQCGAEKKLIGYEESEDLEVEPKRYYVRVTKREKRACAHCPEEGVSCAPLPAKIIEKGKAGNGMVVDVVLKKYCDHTPVYRQVEGLKREAQVDLSRQTLCGWILGAGRLLVPVAGAMAQDLRAGGYIQADETRVPVQSERTQGANHLAWMWEYSRPEGPVVFDFRLNRAREGPAVFLKDFRGVLQSDAYAAYEKVGGAGMIHAGCWAHARRGFFKAWELDKADASLGIILQRIGALYGVERRAREEQRGHEGRLSLRQEKSVPLLGELREKIEALRRGALPRSASGKACDYVLANWEKLNVYARDGRVEIDNNWCENAIRPLALGRKNWLHIGSEEAGPVVAAIASVIETSKRLKIDVRDYLSDVLVRLPGWPAKRVAELTPMAWAKARSQF